MSLKIAKIINRKTNLNIQAKTFYLFWNTYKKENKYIILTRHPKEIIISGYLYHKKCDEKWSKRQGGYYYLGWEKNHFEPEEVAKNTANIDKAKTFCSPIPYQDKLNMLPQEVGILYEMNSVAKLTIDGMYNLEHYGKSNTLTVKFEDLIFNHDETIQGLCKFLKISKSQTKRILKENLQNNLLNQKRNNKITAHTTNVNVEKNRYKQYWNETIEAEFNRLFPADVLSKFGYE